MSTPEISVRLEVPSVEEYLEMRKAAGLSPYDREAAAIGLANSWAAVCVREPADGRIVGMGRVIGDGGLFFQVVDIAVRPERQGRGIGKRIMRELMAELTKRAPPSGFVSLLADGEANRLYAQFGFVFSAPYSKGMQRRVQKDWKLEG